MATSKRKGIKTGKTGQSWTCLAAFSLRHYTHEVLSAPSNHRSNQSILTSTPQKLSENTTEHNAVNTQVGPSQHSWKTSLAQKHNHENRQGQIHGNCVTSLLAQNEQWGGTGQVLGRLTLGCSLHSRLPKGEPILAYPFCCESKNLSRICYIKSYSNGPSKHHMRQKIKG